MRLVPPEALEQESAAAGPRAWLYALRRDQLAADPAYAPWSVRQILWTASGEDIGHIGFHDRPDEDGSVEIGYSVEEAWRGRGIASEALAGMLAFARGQGVERFVLSIAPDNEPSLAIAAKFGFVYVGEQIDERDGPESVFRMGGSGPWSTAT